MRKSAYLIAILLILILPSCRNYILVPWPSPSVPDEETEEMTIEDAGQALAEIHDAISSLADSGTEAPVLKEIPYSGTVTFEAEDTLTPLLNDSKSGDGPTYAEEGWHTSISFIDEPFTAEFYESDTLPMKSIKLNGTMLYSYYKEGAETDPKDGPRHPGNGKPDVLYGKDIRIEFNEFDLVEAILYQEASRSKVLIDNVSASSDTALWGKFSNSLVGGSGAGDYTILELIGNATKVNYSKYFNELDTTDYYEGKTESITYDIGNGYRCTYDTGVDAVTTVILENEESSFYLEADILISTSLDWGNGSLIRIRAFSYKGNVYSEEEALKLPIGDSTVEEILSEIAALRQHL